MPLRLDIKKKLVSRSDRVKCVDLHAEEPWVLCALYNGHMFIWNYETQALLRSFEASDQPLRCCTFVARKQWAISGADDMFIRVYNYNTMEKVKQFEAHMDYIRSIEVHPTLPYLLTSSDDLQIKLWDWERGWVNTQVFEGHAHYVMQVRFNPKDTNTFASASLDRTVKVWSLGSPLPNYSLEGHDKGVNCIDYYTGGDKPYIVTGADDHTVKIWDYQTKSCVQTLDGHTNNVSSVCFHQKLPIILSGSEDGTVRVWHSTTYRLESTLNYGLERAWTIAVSPTSNKVAIGYDEGTIVLKLGQEMPVVCMDNMGNIIQANNNDISASAIRNVPENSGDGERIEVPTKDLGACEIYPQKVAFNNNGRFVVVCGDGEYIIYTAKALRNKSFGSALDFGWSATGTGGDYAVREAQSKIRVYKNFKEERSFKTAYSAEGLFGGHMIGISGADFVCFYDWDDERVIRRIDVTPKNIYWSDSGNYVVLACEDSYFVLSCDRQTITDAISGNGKKVDPDEGVDGSFEYLDEVSEKIRSGQWVGDCFVYTNAAGRLNYYVGGEVITLCHLDKPGYLLGFLAKENRVFLMDKTKAITSFKVLESVLQYQTAIVRRDFEAANMILREIPPSEYNKIARFLEGQGFKEEALQVCTDPEQKFDLALQLQKFDVAVELMAEIVKAQHLVAGESVTSDVQLKWKQLGDLALAKGNIQLARECSANAGDFSGLLLMYTSSGDGKGIAELAVKAREAGRTNVAILCHFLLGNIEQCLQVLNESGRYPEACFMARTYLPSRTAEMLKIWKQDLAKMNPKAAEALADPLEHPDLFPYWKYALQAETISKQRPKVPAANYLQAVTDLELNLIEEMQKLEAGGAKIPLPSASAPIVTEQVTTKAEPVVVAPKIESPVVAKVESPVITKVESPVVAPKVESPVAHKVEPIAQKVESPKTVPPPKVEPAPPKVEPVPAPAVIAPPKPAAQEEEEEEEEAQEEIQEAEEMDDYEILPSVGKAEQKQPPAPSEKPLEEEEGFFDDAEVPLTHKHEETKAAVPPSATATTTTDAGAKKANVDIDDFDDDTGAIDSAVNDALGDAQEFEDDLGFGDDTGAPGEGSKDPNKKEEFEFGDDWA